MGGESSILICGLYYKPITIINDDSSIINKLETSLNDDTRVVIYNNCMFIVQATDLYGSVEQHTLKNVNSC